MMILDLSDEVSGGTEHGEETIRKATAFQLFGGWSLPKSVTLLRNPSQRRSRNRES